VWKIRHKRHYPATVREPIRGENLSSYYQLIQKRDEEYTHEKRQISHLSTKAFGSFLRKRIWYSRTQRINPRALGKREEESSWKSINWGKSEKLWEYLSSSRCKTPKSRGKRKEELS